jgi:NADH-quinone oxidoreductase subunit C
METVEQIRDRLLARLPGATVTLVVNPGPAAEHSLLIDAAHATAIAGFLRDDPALRLDYCSNVTGIDWPAKAAPAPTAVAPAPAPSASPAPPSDCLEAVYHLYSVAHKHGPVILRLRTVNRTDAVALPSLTPVWRSCDFQEREIFDLFGIVFFGHPDLRRLLMWDEFQDHPMRKDYVEPDDYEWEPTAHGAILEKAKAHQSPAPPAATSPS